jgi:hypothetical protein
MSLLRFGQHRLCPRTRARADRKTVSGGPQTKRSRPLSPRAGPAAAGTPSGHAVVAQCGRMRTRDGEADDDDEVIATPHGPKRSCDRTCRVVLDDHRWTEPVPIRGARSGFLAEPAQ